MIQELYKLSFKVFTNFKVKIFCIKLHHISISHLGLYTVHNFVTEKLTNCMLKIRQFCKLSRTVEVFSQTLMWAWFAMMEVHLSLKDFFQREGVGSGRLVSSGGPEGEGFRSF